MRLVLAALSLAAALAAPAARALGPDELAKVVRVLDDRQRNSGDWKALCYMEAKEKGKTDVVYELVVYRRDADDKQMFLFTKPKSEAGKGYLRVEKNLWSYDPSTGRWERRTERERIGGTDMRRDDVSEPRFAEDYTATWEGDEKLGVYDVHRIRLDVKPGVDVSFPVRRLWVDRASLNILKRQDLALSGRLMRTSYYPRWRKIYSESKRGEVWYPEEIRVFDEIEKGNSTLVLIREIDLRALAANIFTKAWLESKSR
ncbi:outer membrane lipoprotein-sorting protein [Anaeromyxobacter oryzisoli]|uniref:outer membrane lipoprotein-sorting protein n=1 Tax=Anaeromyxobacter oryzisoli TaxID=2925408 RepID=UPI001F571A12|nr:outer membrane lipoprotein-sorting protein [Anaeromyxobacter sp. SG63]